MREPQVALSRAEKTGVRVIVDGKTGVLHTHSIRPELVRTPSVTLMLVLWQVFKRMLSCKLSPWKNAIPQPRQISQKLPSSAEITESTLLPAESEFFRENY